jgi:hypothetical protein
VDHCLDVERRQQHRRSVEQSDPSLADLLVQGGDQFPYGLLRGPPVNQPRQILRLGTGRLILRVTTIGSRQRSADVPSGENPVPGIVQFTRAEAIDYIYNGFRAALDGYRATHAGCGMSHPARGPFG